MSAELVLSALTADAEASCHPSSNNHSSSTSLYPTAAVTAELNTTMILTKAPPTTTTTTTTTTTSTDDDEEDDDDDEADRPPQATNGVRRGANCAGDAGSDSGVDIESINGVAIAGALIANNNEAEIGCGPNALHRALSSTSGEYASSSCGVDNDSITAVVAAAANNNASNNSCNSSMISFTSELGGTSNLSSNGSGHHRSANGSILRRTNTTGSHPDCASEGGGSESSSITGGPTSMTSSVTVQRKSSVVRKKVALIEPGMSAGDAAAPGTSPFGKGGAVRKEENAVARSRARTASANRIALQAAKSTAPVAAAPVLRSMERARSRDKNTSGAASSLQSTPLRSLPPSSRSTPHKRTPQIARTPSMPRSNRQHSSAQTPTTSASNSANTSMTSTTDGPDMGRWPSSSSSFSSMATTGQQACYHQQSLVIKTKVGPICLDTSSHSAVDSPAKNFATLPRRRKEKSDDDLRSSKPRSSSAQRDRMTASTMGMLPPATTTTTQQQQQQQQLVRRQHPKAETPTGQMRQSAISTAARRTTLSGIRVQQASPQTPYAAVRTRIYHETGVQTALNGDDITSALAGILTPAMRQPIDAADTETRACQVDIRDAEIEALLDQLRGARAEVAALHGALNERGQQLSSAEQQLGRERDEKQAMRAEMQSNTQRVLGMLALVHQDAASSASVVAVETADDSLLMLESQIQQSGHALEAKQCEIAKLYGFCRTLQTEMQRSMSVQRSLLAEKDELEKESTELQDFLQDEKSTLVDALRDAELEAERMVALLGQRDADIERLQEECRHLVRISEQRRHEFHGMQSKYNVLEQRSRVLIDQQTGAVSGASMALGDLGARLNQLVEQLISSYSISEQELEDVVFHNEAYTNDSADATPADQQPVPPSHLALSNNGTVVLPLSNNDAGALSPQRHQSFIAAVISAIRNAASSSANKHLPTNDGGSVHPHHPAGMMPVAGGVASSAPSTFGNNNNNNSNSIDDLAGNDSDSTEMLDSETEPCLMMENVLEDVSMPDTHSHNLVSSSSCSQQAPTTAPSSSLHLALQAPTTATPTLTTTTTRTVDEESIHNLSQAIYNRQQIEQHASRLALMRTTTTTANAHLHSSADENDDSASLADQPSMVSCCAAVAASSSAVAMMMELNGPYGGTQHAPLVDQIIRVDNLVTKLLKVLRIIQMDNDNCIQQLIGDKNALQLNKEELQLRLHDWEQMNAKLRNDLDAASGQLRSNSGELAHSKVELLKHRAEIDRLNVDICQLSTLCQNGGTTAAAPAAATENVVLAQLAQAACQNPELRQHFRGATDNGEPPMLGNLQGAIVDSKRQYEAIDRALETLNGMQSTVQQSPALLRLQRDLEETNFTSASNIPIYTAILSAAAAAAAATSTPQQADCNANAAQNKQQQQSQAASATGAAAAAAAATTSGSADGNNSGNNVSPGRQMRVDSIA